MVVGTANARGCAAGVWPTLCEARVRRGVACLYLHAVAPLPPEPHATLLGKLM